MKIIPAILAKTYGEFEEMVRKIEPYADLVHLDIADGEFVPNKTIGGIEELNKIDTKLDFEIHLMIKNPESNIDKWLETKAIRYLIHRESEGEIDNLINVIKASGHEVGIVLNSITDPKTLEPYLERVDLVQFMTVNPGFYGSPFLPEVLEKIRKFHDRYSDKAIQVDGGIHSDTIKLVSEAGVASAVLGSHIFSEGRDVGEVLNELRSQIQ